MASIEGTQTEKHMVTAFSGESRAMNRYTYFTKQAKRANGITPSSTVQHNDKEEKNGGEI